jgi:hypothetical protein
MPDYRAILLSELVGDTTAVTKDKAGNLSLKMGARTGEAVDSLLDQMSKDPHYVTRYKVPNPQQTQRDFPPYLSMQYTTDITVDQQAPEKYSRHLTASSGTGDLVTRERPWTAARPPLQPRPAPVGQKKIAAWEQGTYWQYTPPSPTTPIAPGRGMPAMNNPRGYSPGGQPPVQERLLERMEQAGQAMEAVPFEKGQSMKEMASPVTPNPPASAPVAPPAVAAPAEKKSRKK